MYALRDVEEGDYVSVESNGRAGFAFTIHQANAKQWDRVEELIEDVTVIASESGESLVGYSVVKLTLPEAPLVEEVV